MWLPQSDAAAAHAILLSAVLSPRSEERMRRMGGLSLVVAGRASVGLPVGSVPIGRTIVVLAVLAGLAHVLDLLTFLQVMATNGPSVEANPVSRWLFMFAGPAGLAMVKLTIA